MRMGSFSSTRHRLRSLLALLPLAAAVGVLSGSAGAASGLTWAAPVQVDHQAPFGHTNSFTGVSCPTSSFCAAVDGEGNVLTSTNPTGGESAWAIAPIDGQLTAPRSLGEVLTAVSCPSTTLCVAVDNIGNVITSTNPGAGAPAWSAAAVDAPHALLGVSCAPSTTLCVAVDGSGDVVAPNNPTGGAG